MMIPIVMNSGATDDRDDDFCRLQPIDRPVATFSSSQFSNAGKSLLNIKNSLMAVLCEIEVNRSPHYRSVELFIWLGRHPQIRFQLRDSFREFYLGFFCRDRRYYHTVSTIHPIRWSCDTVTIGELERIDYS
jgi:hypothetical protein